MKPVVKAFTTASILLAVMIVMPTRVSAKQPPPHCVNVLLCLFNQEAMESDAVGIHRYSKHLIELIVPNPAGNTAIDQFSSELTDRLAKAEQGARGGGRKLVPEAAVVKAFNDLMQEVGAPPSMRATEASVHGFREHAASIKVFPALLSANRNGANCNPGEAVFLLSLLLSDSGVLLEGNIDSAVALMQWDGQRNGGSPNFGFGVTQLEPTGSSASGLLSWYTLHHNLNASMVLFDRVAGTLGL